MAKKHKKNVVQMEIDELLRAAAEGNGKAQRHLTEKSRVLFGHDVILVIREDEIDIENTVSIWEHAMKLGQVMERFRSQLLVSASDFFSNHILKDPWSGKPLGPGETGYEELDRQDVAMILFALDTNALKPSDSQRQVVKQVEKGQGELLEEVVQAWNNATAVEKEAYLDKAVYRPDDHSPHQQVNILVPSPWDFVCVIVSNTTDLKANGFEHLSPAGTKFIFARTVTPNSNDRFTVSSSEAYDIEIRKRSHNDRFFARPPHMEIVKNTKFWKAILDAYIGTPIELQALATYLNISWYSLPVDFESQKYALIKKVFSLDQIGELYVYLAEKNAEIQKLFN